MFSKIAFFALLVATAHASGGYSSFSYAVSDPNTGDIKDQQENRVGSNVVGKYSLLESDGTKRIVEYSADEANGFKAVVHKEPIGAFGAASIGGPLGHAGALAGNLGHGTLGVSSHVAPFAAGSPLVHSSLGAASPLAHGALANSYSHGAVANPLAYGNTAGIAGQAALYGNYGNTLGASLGYAGRGVPTVSSYSHSIVHNGPDSAPYIGTYGNNGYGGYGAHGASLGGAALAQANPWAAGARLSAGSAHLTHANPWAPGTGLASGLASPLAAGAHGGYATGLGYGNRLNW